jgi:predicted SAM-dependent methyltransferase
VDFILIGPTDACPLRSGSIDFVYGLSIFTHLTADSERFWLAELHRLLKPKGVAVMTVHGELAFFKEINDSPQYQRLLRNGFMDVGPNEDLRVSGKETISEKLYRNVFHTRNYIETVWGHYFKIVDYIPGGSAGHQDYVVMIRK